jgi:hypothetical protein
VPRKHQEKRVSPKRPAAKSTDRTVNDDDVEGVAVFLDEEKGILD